ncbi:hypothetical protein M569_01838 [Genlisea aurea]|uniref:Ribosome biogenesis protein NOP53 n=1 Tax=Genlisea aurea TaxID=192259 RepID=S8EK15_9LAMI|nr:hypothetical protein M569_01838 [Genlisea aurea]
MGKRSRGKKAWRAKISTEEIEDYFEKSTKDALSGGTLLDVRCDSDFYCDKSTDVPVKKKIEKIREKVLRRDSLLQRNPFVKPIPSSVQRKKTTKHKPFQIAKDKHEEEEVHGSAMDDPWKEDAEENARVTKKSKSSAIPAVEVEPPGCSFNPHPHSHQDALATAVADEMQKIYRKELGPEPVPLIVPGEVIDEEEKYFLDVDDGHDDEEEEEEEDNRDSDTEKRAPKAKRLTRVDLNRRARRKEQLKIEAEARKVAGLSKSIDDLPTILETIAKEDEEKHKRQLRRTVARSEKLKSRPPRLGKHKYVPGSVQVLLSEERTGSLRQLKGCCTLLRDRYKSLEKRGLVVPSKKNN